MDKLEILRQAKQKVDALVAEKKREQTDDAGEKDSAYLAVLMTATDSIIEAIEGSKVNEERIAEAVRAEIEKIRLPDTVVNVPELKLPVFNVPKSEIEVKIPEIVVPEPKVTVNVPKMEAPVVNIPPFPEIKMPDSMEIHGDVGLFGYGFDNPLPVQLRDAKGNPVDLGGMVGGQVSGGGGRFVKVTNDADSPIPITGSITSTPGATYYASDAVGSVNIVQSIPLDVSISGATGTLATNIVDSTGVAYSGSNPVPVTTVPSAITATTVDATASGDNTIVAITNSPRLYYISLSANGANSADVTAIVKIGASSKYKVSLKAGAIWARHIGAGDRYITGSAGDDIIVNLSAVQTVHVSVEYADV